MQRLNKFLASCGVASRRKCDEIIFEGRIKINGEIIKTPYTQVNTQDIVTFDGKKIFKEQKLYFILNKPKGFICSNSQYIKKRVIDLFQDFSCRLYTVGRLDKDTTGLLIVTNDGDFANKVIHPSFNLEKEYLAKVNRDISLEDLKKISLGVFIENKKIIPVSVKKISSRCLKIKVKEGKKHEVRLMVGKVLTILELQRIRIGPISLGNLKIGFYRKMTVKERLLF